MGRVKLGIVLAAAAGVGVLGAGVVSELTGWGEPPPEQAAQGHWQASAGGRTAFSIPAPIALAYSLNGVSAATPSDAWIVGRKPRGGNRDVTAFAWRWDGATWRDVPLALPSTHTGLFGVADVSPDDAWAVGVVGDRYVGIGGRPLVMHWDGADWRSVATPRIRAGILYAVAAAGPRDVWAVGRRGTGQGDRQNRPLVWHFDGSEWRDVSIRRHVAGTLDAVQASAADDVWITTSQELSPGPALLHWDGNRLDLLPNPFGLNAGAQSVTPLGGGRAYAVGYRHGPCANDHDVPVSARWDGRHWTSLPTPRMGTDTALGVVGSTAAGSIWAVGASGEVHVRPDTCAGDQGLGVRYLGTMFERWNGRAWDIDPTGQTILAGLGPTIELPHASIALVGQTGWFVASDPWRTAVAQLRGGRWYAAEHPRDSVRRT